ncbi:hypothetical protein AVEN_74783-1 [Araneus ventricosus]|uniref:DUF4371 domain-containing protein n=1 Tax=Araneus ventricosus TaxID=182803 RepID=A0A4Y2T5T6_ARAVE|nr:hypothetical protein AVEN_74783-1 [Araneus ventricosus]
MSSQGQKEELLGLLPLSGQTRGEDIANAVQKCVEDNGIDINKIVSIATDVVRNMESGKLLHLKNLKQYRDETNATIDTSYFSIALKNMKDGFADRFEQFKTNKGTLTFIVNPLNTNTNEINIEHLELMLDRFKCNCWISKPKACGSSQNSRASWKSWRSRNACTSRSTSGQL